MKDIFILSDILSGTKNSSPKFLNWCEGKTTALLNQCTLKVNVELKTATKELNSFLRIVEWMLQLKPNIIQYVQ